MVVAGNHDWAFAHEPAATRNAFAGAGIAYLQDSEVSLGGPRFHGSPWQPVFHDCAFNLPRGPALAAVWAKIPTGIDVLVTHAPPEGFCDRLPDGERTGCADLLARIDVVRPRLHVFGHIHQDGGVWHRGNTVFANVTTWECERAPTVFDIDDRRVAAVHVPPAERS